MNKPRDTSSDARPEAATEHTRSRYDAVAPIYDVMEWPVERWLFRSWREELWAQIDGPEVLEIGVGTGKNVPYYPEGADVTGIDLSPKMLKRARQVIYRRSEASATLRVMDAQELGFPDETFDEVVSTFVFCSVPDPVQGLREALRVTRPGGRLHLLEHMRAPSPWLGPLMDTLDRPVHWLTGVHIARETVRNVERSGWALEELTSLTRSTIFRHVQARKPA